MKLVTWRQEKGWTRERLADELDTTISSIFRYETGRRDPEAGVKERIFVISEGAVTPNDFYDIPRWRRLVDAALARIGRKAA